MPLRLDEINLGLLTRALGLEPTVNVDTRVERAASGDIVLVCTDGLSGPVPEEEIAAILAAATDLDATAQRLIEGAHSRGGRDDVTCVLVRWRKNVLIHKTRDPRAIPQHAPPQASSARCVSGSPTTETHHA